MRRSYLLRIVSLLSILIAFVRLAFGIFMIVFFTNAANVEAVPPKMLRFSFVAFGLILVYVIAMIFCGFHGAVTWDDPPIAIHCFYYGMGTTVIGLVGNLFQHLSGYPVSVPVWVCSVAMPVLYAVVGLIVFLRYRAYRKKKDAEGRR